jgi:hypothetical protein
MNSTFENYISCNNIKPFIKSIVEALPFSGISDSKFFLCELKNVQFLVKLSLYKKTDPELYGRHTINHLHPIDAEISIMKQLESDFIKTNVTPCLLEIIYHVKCDNIKSLIPKSVDCKDYVFVEKFTDFNNYIYHILCGFNELVAHHIARDTISFTIMDRCDLTLKSYLENYVDTNPLDVVMLKSILFQIIYTIYRIRKKYPKFRHNDLHAENIMLMFDSKFQYEPESPTFIVFKDNNTFYNVPYFGVICKIIDFGYSVLPELNLYSNIVDDKIWKYYHIDNDIINLFCGIYDILKNKAPVAINIMEKIDPSNSYLHCDSEYMRNTHVTTIEEMINSDSWNVYKSKKIHAGRIYKIFS